MSASLTAKHYDSAANYERFVNPQWAPLLDILGMNVRYERYVGCEMFTADGHRMLDFNSGYCLRNAGHNHPAIEAAVAMMHRGGDFWSETLGNLCTSSYGRYEQEKVFSGERPLQNPAKFKIINHHWHFCHSERSEESRDSSLRCAPFRMTSWLVQSFPGDGAAGDRFDLTPPLRRAP
jgi:hypothetical protein